MIDPGSQKQFFDFIDGLRTRGVSQFSLTLEGNICLQCVMEPKHDAKPTISEAQRQALLKDPTTPKALREELERMGADEEERDLLASV